MEATKKRRGRPRKIILNSGNNSPARKEPNIHVTDCKWTAVGSPYGLKIVLRKIDVRNSALVCHQNEVSPTSNKNLKFLSPQLTLPRIDSMTKQVEENISFLTIDNREDGQSLQQVYAAYSESIIRSPNMRPVFTRSIYSSMNAVVEDDSCIRRRSRRILKDVKNTSNNRKIRKNASLRPNSDGQENIPVASSYDASVALPQVCVRLPQLNDQNFHQHDLVEEYIESSSMVNSLQDSVKSRFQSITVHGINSGGPGNSSSEMIMKSFIQMNEIKGPVHLEAAELPSLEAAPPAKRGRRRKSRKRRTALESRREEPKEKSDCQKNARSSSIVTRHKATANHIQLSDTSSQETLCETIPSLEISRNTVECPMNNDESTQIIRKEAALQFCRTSFEDQENDIYNFPQSPNGLQETEFRLINISTVKLHYSSAEKKTIEESEQQSFSFIGKRKRRGDDSSTESNEYCAPKKRPFGNYNCDKVKSSSNGMNNCVVHIKRIQKIRQSPNAICTFQSPNSSGSRNHRSIQPSSSYVTRNKASKNKGSVEFHRIPWKKVKRVEKLNEKPAKSDVKENCYPVKPEVKRKYVKAKKKSSKTNPVSPYLCYRTRQKTARNGESTEFYRLPWKKTKGFEVVVEKSKKVDIKREPDDDDPTFKGWPKKNVSVALPTISAQDAETSISKKGILKHNDMLASSTPFPESSRRNANVSFASDNDRSEVDALSPVKGHQKTNATNHVFNGFPMRSCTVLLTCIPNPVPRSANRSKKRMTRREARRKAESFNKSKKAFEVEAQSDRSNSNSRSKRSRRGVKRSDRLVDKRIKYCYSTENSSSSSEEEQEILVNRNKQTTPYVRLRKLNAADITSYKITPLKEDRIPKKSKTDDDYGIDDINTDDSTDDEEFPKKCIPQWVKDHQNQLHCQSYMNQDMIYDWMKPPQFQYSLRHVFFSMKSHTFM